MVIPYVVQQRCLTKRVGSPYLPTQWYNILPIHFPYPSNSDPQIFTSGIAMLCILTMAIPDNELYRSSYSLVQERCLNKRQV